MDQTESYRLSELWVYPVKSLPGIKMDTAYAGERGLDGDRRFMLADENGRFISIREYPDLLRFRLEMDESHIAFGFGGGPAECRVLRMPQGGQEVQVTVWDDTVIAAEPDPAVSDWFSGILKKPCRLVYMTDESERKISPAWQTGMDRVSFADGYAYLAVTRASLEQLSLQAGQFMDVRRFRPNLVIDGPASGDELRWSAFSIGNLDFQGLKPCERCVVTTIDPDRMESGKEPLRTLSTRRVNGKAVFGQHCSVKGPGTLAVNDVVTVISRKDSPYDPLHLN